MSILHRALCRLFCKPAPASVPPTSWSPAQAIRAAEVDINARLHLLEEQTRMRITGVHLQYDSRDPIPYHVVGLTITMAASGKDK